MTVSNVSPLSRTVARCLDPHSIRDDSHARSLVRDVVDRHATLVTDAHSAHGPARLARDR
jgi:hypothetical protein